MSLTPESNPVPPTPAPAPRPLVPPKPLVPPPPAAASVAPAVPTPSPETPCPVAKAPLNATRANQAPAFNKLPDSPSFVSPMPAIEEADDSIPVFLPIVAAFAAIGAIAVAVLLYLKNAS